MDEGTKQRGTAGIVFVKHFISCKNTATLYNTIMTNEVVEIEKLEIDKLDRKAKKNINIWGKYQ